MVKRNRVVCFDWYETEEYMWMCLADRNAICKINKETREVKILGRYPETEYVQEKLSFTVVHNGDKLIFLPYYADCIAVVDVESDALHFISVREYSYLDWNKHGKFVTAFSKGEYVYMFGMGYPAILRLNVGLMDLDYFYYSDCVRGSCIAPYCQMGYVQSDDKLIFTTGENGNVIEYDLENNKGEIKKIGSEETRFLGIAKEEYHIWMTFETLKEKNISCWNVKTNEMKMIPILNSGLYYPPIIYKNYLYLFPFEGKNVLVLDTREHKCCVQEKLTDVLQGGDSAKVMTVKQMGNIIKFQTGGSRCWYEYNMETHLLKEEYFEIVDPQFADRWKQKKKEEIEKVETILTEGCLQLKEYVQLVDRDRQFAQKCIEGYGHNIYQMLKRI